MFSTVASLLRQKLFTYNVFFKKQTNKQTYFEAAYLTKETYVAFPSRRKMQDNEN